MISKIINTKFKPINECITLASIVVDSNNIISNYINIY